MSHPLTLPLVGVLTLAGAALGVHLGNESISEINPIYFQDPPTRFHSDLSPYQSPSAGTYAARMDTAGPLELGTGCIGCRTYPQEYRPERDPAIEQAIEGVPEAEAQVQLAALPIEADPALDRRQADVDRLQRYASYTVSADQQEAQASLPAEEPAAQGVELEPTATD